MATQINESTAWYKNLGEGVLCWVKHVDDDVFCFSPDIITSYNEKYDYKYEGMDGQYLYAQPLSEDEISSFLNRIK